MQDDFDVSDVLDKISCCIGGYEEAYLNNVARWIINGIFQDQDIEDAASYAVNYLLHGCKQAKLRVENGFNLERSEKEYNQYIELLKIVLYCIKVVSFNVDEENLQFLESTFNFPEPQPEQAATGHRQENPKPQQKRHKPARSKGRPKETLKDKMINDIDGSKLQKIHKVMGGKKGKDAALIILACIKIGWMQKPTFTQVTEEFGDIGNRTGFTKYLNENLFNDTEIQGVIQSLEQND